MKKHIVIPALFLFLALFVSSSLHSQSPQGIPYQAVMRNADGSVMASSAVSLTFMIHDGTANGTVVYQESHSLTSNTQGLVSCVVGNGVVLQGNFAQINWGSGAKFLHVMMGSDASLLDLGTQQMLSVPYALHSKTSDNGFSSVSATGDTLYMANGSFIIVPGISAANFPPAVLGCMDNEACNYNSAAEQDNNTCLYINSACNDGNTGTLNDLINADCICIGIPNLSGGLGSIVLPNYPNCSNEFISVSGCSNQESLEYQGVTYNLTEINGQCWFAENLRASNFQNGDPIESLPTPISWTSATAPGYRIYENLVANDLQFGKLYNGFVISDQREICPIGWHVPTSCEWYYLHNSAQTLTTTNLSTALRSTSGWAFSSNGTNEFGFNSLPNGRVLYDGTEIHINYYADWWTSTILNDFRINAKADAFNTPGLYEDPRTEYWGSGIRCLKD